MSGQDEQTKINMLTDHLLLPLDEVQGWDYDVKKVKYLASKIGDVSQAMLTRIVDELILNSKWKPKIGEIIKAINDRPDTNAGGITENWADLQKRRDEEAARQQREVADYAESFLLRSPISQEAKRDGWFTFWEGYVHKTARTMWQIINEPPKRGFGWEGCSMPLEMQPVYLALLKKAAPDLRKTQQIDVMLALPDMACQAWKVTALHIADIKENGYKKKREPIKDFRGIGKQVDEIIHQTELTVENAGQFF